jgi:hypothetical protein
METKNIENVRAYALNKFCEILDGKYELPKYQSLDDIETEYISQDIDTREFVDNGIFGLLGVGEDGLMELLEPIEAFCDKLQQARKKFSESHQINELKKIIEVIEEKIKQLKKSLD